MKSFNSKSAPIRNDKPKGGQIWRVPPDGYVTPRLRQEQARTEAVGFIHNFDTEEET